MRTCNLISRADAVREALRLYRDAREAVRRCREAEDDFGTLAFEGQQEAFRWMVMVLMALPGKDNNVPTKEPNEPLTIEQLREMDGEPVWIVEHPDWGHWELSADAEDYIADRDQDLYGLKHDDPAGQCGLHVLGWLAYRRPPERQEDT